MSKVNPGVNCGPVSRRETTIRARVNSCRKRQRHSGFSPCSFSVAALRSAPACGSKEVLSWGKVTARFRFAHPCLKAWAGSCPDTWLVEKLMSDSQKLRG